jgi:hypothetical protein
VTVLPHYNTTPLINNLEIRSIFNNKSSKEAVSVTDFILAVVVLFKGDLNKLIIIV